MARELSGVALTAKKIREHLKREFPEVKFSVKSSSYSMGNSVSIHWTDGPVCSVVDLITDQYQYGSFDGMTDSYSYCDVNPALGCPGTKYVSTNRTQSPERKAELEAHCMEKYGRIIEQYSDWREFNPWKYEISTPETWLPRYKEMLDKANHERYEAEEAERQAYLAELEVKEQEEQLKASGKVVSLADRRKAKEQVQKEADEQRAHAEAEYITSMVSTMSLEQIRELILNVYSKPDFTNEQKLVTIRHFLSILAERDRPSALRLFKEIDLQALAK